MKVSVIARENTFCYPSFKANVAPKPAAAPAPAPAAKPKSTRSGIAPSRIQHTPPPPSKKGRQIINVAKVVSVRSKVIVAGKEADGPLVVVIPSNVMMTGEEVKDILIAGDNIKIKANSFMAAKGIKTGENLEAINLQSGGPAVIGPKAAINRLFVEDQSGQPSIVKGSSKVKEIEYFGCEIELAEPQNIHKLTVVSFNNQQMPVLNLGSENTLGFSGFLGIKRRTKLFLNPKTGLAITLPPDSTVKPEKFLEHAKGMISFCDSATGRKLSKEIVEKVVKVALRTA